MNPLQLENVRPVFDKLPVPSPGGATDLSRWLQPPVGRPPATNPGRGDGFDRTTPTMDPTPLPGLEPFFRRDRWLKPPANIRRPSGTLDRLLPIFVACLACLLAPADSARSAGEETGGNSSATLELRGLLTPLDQANLSSRSTGVIREMKQEGDEVHKGQVVVSLEDEAEKLQVESSQAILDKRRFESNSATKLHEQGTDSEDEARTAKTNLQTEEIQLKQALVAEDKKTVKAPFDGVVTHRIREVGEAVDQYFPLLTVVNLSKVYLETYLPANRLRDVQPGQPVEVRVPDLPGRTFKGEVSFIAPVIDPASGEFRLKILLPNEDRALRSGMGAIGLLTLTHATPTANPALPPKDQATAR